MSKQDKAKRITIRLRPSQISAAKKIASRKDIPYQTMIRSWIHERIEHERIEIEKNKERY